LVAKPKERGHLEDLSVEGRIEIKWTINVSVWTAFIWFR
jgi:hypothetical protein